MGKEETLLLLEELSSPLDLSDGTVGIILAAGHGKRIKSEKSKMLHEIWGVPTVLRVRSALEDGLGNSSQFSDLSRSRIRSTTSSAIKKSYLSTIVITSFSFS